VALWRSDSDGSNQVQLTTQPLVGGGICTPDSKFAIFASDNAMWKVPLEGGPPEKTTLPLADINFSPDGKLMVTRRENFENGNLRSSLFVTATGGGPPLYTSDIPFGMQSLRFTPDNKAIAYTLTRNLATNLWKQPLSGGDPVQVTKFTSGQIFAYAWSQDGKQLAFLRGQRKSDVVMMSNFR
jgi:Tol biopolymer transport system component